MSLLGLDIGTTGCKAIAFDADGDILGSAYREYSLRHPRPGWSELEPDYLWDSVKMVIREAVHAARARDPVKAISVSTQGEAVVPIGKDGRALCNFSVSFDDRTMPQSQWWADTLGKERIFAITGMPLHPMHSINKIMWFRENMPGVYRNAWKFLCVEDFANFRLCASPTIDYSLAGRTMAFDVQKKTWSEEILSLAKLDRERLAEARPSGEIVGPVSPRIALDLGLDRDVVVVTGGHDQICGALGAGVVEEGMAVNSTGTSDVITAAFRAPLLVPEMRDNNYCCYPHAKDGMYATLAVNLTGGLLLRWYRDTLCAEEVAQAKATESDAYDLILQRASTRPADVLIFPHFVGSGTPSLDPSAKGVIVGLTVSTTKRDLTRAVLDSLNYEMKLNLDTLEKAGVKVTELRAIGGGAKSELWLQMKADVFERDVVSLTVSEAACLGAAILAGSAIGEYHSVDAGVQKAVKIKKEYHPREAEKEAYRSRYEAYREMYRSVLGLNGFLRPR